MSKLSLVTPIRLLALGLSELAPASPSATPDAPPARALPTATIPVVRGGRAG